MTLLDFLNIISEEKKILKDYTRLFSSGKFVESKQLIDAAYNKYPDNFGIKSMYIARLINDRDKYNLDKEYQKDDGFTKSVLLGYLKSTETLILENKHLSSEDLIFRAKLVSKMLPEETLLMSNLILGTVNVMIIDKNWNPAEKLCEFGLDYIKENKLEKNRKLINQGVIHTFYFFRGLANYNLKKYNKSRNYLIIAMKETKNKAFLDETQKLLWDVERKI